MTARSLRDLSCCLGVLLAGVAALAQQAASASADDRPDVRESFSIAVAPFSRSGAPGSELEVPDLDVASVLIGQLAERLPPGAAVSATFEVSTTGPLEARQVREWASDAGVDAVVFGRVRPAEGDSAVPRAVAVEVEVRSGHSGVTTANYELARVEVEEPAAAIEILAESILSGLGYQPPSPQPEAAEESPQEDSGFKLFRKGEAISIESDELEVTQDGDVRHIIFRRSVRVEQGDVRLRSERLDAYYNKGESQPDRLEARGDVRLEYGERSARCDRVTFYNSDQRVVCSGHAVLRQGCELVRGLEIEFDLREERIRVLGAASVVVQTKKDEDGKCRGEQL